MAQKDFVEQLKALALEVHEETDGRMWFPYDIPVGKFAGQTVKVGYAPLPDFPSSPPGGPHISPRLLPINTQQGPHPAYGVHESPAFGSDWEYWSRPMHQWPQSKRTARDVIAHLNRLFETQ